MLMVAAGGGEAEEDNKTEEEGACVLAVLLGFNDSSSTSSSPTSLLWLLCLGGACAAMEACNSIRAVLPTQKNTVRNYPYTLPSSQPIAHTTAFRRHTTYLVRADTRDTRQWHCPRIHRGHGPTAEIPLSFCECGCDTRTDTWQFRNALNFLSITIECALVATQNRKDPLDRTTRRAHQQRDDMYCIDHR